MAMEVEVEDDIEVIHACHPYFYFSKDLNMYVCLMLDSKCEPLGPTFCI